MKVFSAGLEAKLKQIPSSDIAVKVQSPDPNHSGKTSVTTGNLIQNPKTGKTEIITAAHGANENYMNGNPWVAKNSIVTFQRKSTQQEIGSVKAVQAGDGKQDIAAVQTSLDLPETNTKFPEANSKLPTDKTLNVSVGFKSGELQPVRSTKIMNAASPLTQHLTTKNDSSKNVVNDGLVAMQNNGFDKGDSGAIANSETNSGTKEAKLMIVQGSKDEVFGINLGLPKVLQSIKQSIELAKEALKENTSKNNADSFSRPNSFIA